MESESLKKKHKKSKKHKSKDREKKKKKQKNASLSEEKPEGVTETMAPSYMVADQPNLASSSWASSASSADGSPLKAPSIRIVLKVPQAAQQQAKSPLKQVKPESPGQAWPSHPKPETVPPIKLFSPKLPALSSFASNETSSFSTANLPETILPKMDLDEAEAKPQPGPGLFSFPSTIPKLSLSFSESDSLASSSKKPKKAKKSKKSKHKKHSHSHSGHKHSHRKHREQVGPALDSAAAPTPGLFTSSPSFPSFWPLSEEMKPRVPSGEEGSSIDPPFPLLKPFGASESVLGPLGPAGASVASALPSPALSELPSIRFTTGPDQLFGFEKGGGGALGGGALAPLTVDTSTPLHSTESSSLFNCGLPPSVSPIQTHHLYGSQRLQAASQGDPWFPGPFQAGIKPESCPFEPMVSLPSPFPKARQYSSSPSTGPEIKLKLSKTASGTLGSSSLYSSNLSHSPSKAVPAVTVTPAVPVIPHKASPPSASVPFTPTTFGTSTSTSASTLEVPPLKISSHAHLSPSFNLKREQTSPAVRAASPSSLLGATTIASKTISPPLPAQATPLPSTFSPSLSSFKNSQITANSSGALVGGLEKKPRAIKNLTTLLLHLHRQLNKRDSKHFFAQPVSDAIAPGYSSLISHPMDLSTIRHNITSGVYHNLGDFKADVKLMCENAMKYNRPETIYHKAAAKLWHYTKSKLFKKDALAEYAKSYTKCTILELSLNSTSSAHARSSGNSSSITPTPTVAPYFELPSTLPPMETSSFSSSATLGACAGAADLGFEMTPVFGSLISNGSTSFTGSLATSTEVKLESPKLKTVPSAFAFNPPPPPVPAVPVIAKRDLIVSDGMTAKELIASIKKSARKAAKAVSRSRRPITISYLEPSEGHGTVMRTLVSATNGNKSTACPVIPSWKPVSLASLYTPNENEEGDGALLANLLLDEKGHARKVPFEVQLVNGEDTENTTPPDLGAKAPSDQLSSEEATRLRKKLENSYGDAFGLEYALSIARFGRGSEYSEHLVNSLLGVLTSGEHRNVSEAFYRQVNAPVEH